MLHDYFADYNWIMKVEAPWHPILCKLRQIALINFLFIDKLTKLLNRNYWINHVCYKIVQIKILILRWTATYIAH